MRLRALSLLFCLSLVACRTDSASTVKDDDAGGDAGVSAVATPTPAPKLWTDHFPNALPKELADAAAAHVAPVAFTGPESVAAVGANACPFKWVLAPDGTFYGLIYLRGDKIKHSIVLKGQPAVSAGFAISDGTTITIDDHSGHYRPDVASLDYAKQALLNLGFADVQIAKDGVTIPDSDLCQYNTHGH